MGKRVLVIGLDGFERSIADRLMDQGQMPNLQRLMARSATMELEHGAARRTGLAWEHFATGLSPERARRWSAVTFDPQQYRCTQEPTSFTPFPSKFGFKTVVFDAPYFDLQKAPDVDGFVSWGAHDPGVQSGSHPEQLFGEIIEKFGTYPAKPWIYGFVWPSVERTQSMGKSLSEAVLLRAKIAKWLLSERFVDWSLGIVVISELHSAIEALWHGVDESHPLHSIASAQPAREALESVYEAVDQLLGILVETFSDCLHVVFSIHGMGPNTADVPAMALLPEFLYRRHFGHQHLREFPSLEASISHFCANGTKDWSSFIADNWKKKSFLIRGLRRFRATNSNNKENISTNTIRWMPASWYANYWPEMPAFAMPAYYDGQIRINVQGREAKGIVPAGEYDAMCKAIASELSSSVDKSTGQPAVKDIVFTHPGEPMAVSNTEADIIVIWAHDLFGLRTQKYGDIGPLPPRRPGGHTGGAGMGLWSGPDINPGEYGLFSSFDMVPSLIEYLTGDSLPDIDGQSFIDKIQSYESTQ